MVHFTEDWKNSFPMTSQAMLPASPLRPRYFIMAVLCVIVMIVAIIGPSDWFLNWVHVMFGTLWTGIDLFMGFVVGPVLRTLPLETRRAVLNGLIPRTLVLMPTLSIVTGTAGWFLAKRLGYLEIAYPEFYWVAAALAILTVLTLQGLGTLAADQSPGLFRVAEAGAEPRADWRHDAALIPRGGDPGLDAGCNDRGDGALRDRALEHDPEKWTPIFRKDHAQAKDNRRRKLKRKRGDRKCKTMFIRFSNSLGRRTRASKTQFRTPSRAQRQPFVTCDGLKLFKHEAT